MQAFKGTVRPNFNPGDSAFLDLDSTRVLKPHPTTFQGVSKIVRTVTATGNVAASDEEILGDTTGGAITLTLPPAASLPLGSQISVTKIDAAANAVSVARNGTDTINGAGTAISTGTTQWARKNFVVISPTGWISF